MADLGQLGLQLAKEVTLSVKREEWARMETRTDEADARG